MYILLVFIIVISFPLGYWITFQPISYLLYKMEKSFAPIFLKNFFFIQKTDMAHPGLTKPARRQVF